MCGDGESAEGSVWEAMAFASHYKLDNLVNIIDVNRLGQSEATMHQHDLDTYKRKCEAFGWYTQVIDGHSVSEIVTALNNAANHKGQPACIIAKTFKGKFMPEIEDSASWHGKPLGSKGESVIKSIQALIKTPTDKLACELLPIRAPSTMDVKRVDIGHIGLSKAPGYKLGEEVSVHLYCVLSFLLDHFISQMNQIKH